VVTVLHQENVLARRYFFPACHRMEPYRSTSPVPRRPLPVTEQLAASLMTLPTGTAVGVEEIQTICRILKLAGRSTTRRAQS
jgi:dTDP-4-amino-4,6-dideoxygalactose transaminase